MIAVDSDGWPLLRTVHEIGHFQKQVSCCKRQDIANLSRELSAGLSEMFGTDFQAQTQTTNLANNICFK